MGCEVDGPWQAASTPNGSRFERALLILLFDRVWDVYHQVLCLLTVARPLRERHWHAFRGGDPASLNFEALLQLQLESYDVVCTCK